MYIHQLKDMDWKRVCKVRAEHFGNKWYYENINREIMFSEHKSWVYAITVDGRIVKIGETGQPLGIEAKRDSSPKGWEKQPKFGSQSRLGRYRSGDTTDRTIRDSLRPEVKSNRVEIYAYKCRQITEEVSINGNIKVINSDIHKILEKTLLDEIEKVDGERPFLNPRRC